MSEVRTFLAVGAFFLLFFMPLPGFSQGSKDDSLKIKKSGVPKDEQKCPENADRMYVRQRVLEQFAEILNKSIPEFEKMNKVKFSARNDRGILFFIHDLSDVSNKEIRTTDCVDFKDKHIYHFAPHDSMFSLSHIAFLEGGKLTVFKSVNCSLRGDRIERVIKYLEEKLRDEPNKSEVIERVRNYRDYGNYFTADMPLISC